ncbi:MAG: DNA primase small subunit domain-containing protein [Candidatus Nezhaarchaeales archaeon]
MRSNLSNEDYVKKMFRSYYLKWRGDPPKEYDRREYAFMLSKKGDMIRHKSFEKWDEIREFLAKNAPLHVFYSSAYYLQPSAPDMDAKEWMGADLIFDIDVDHIYTPCKEDHDKWICLECGFNGKGMVPEACPACSSKRIESKTWFCEKCIDIAKEETIKLVEDFLIHDFGFSPTEIEIVFSGRRGFHIHVENDVVKELDQRARREIVDYIKGIGLTIQEKRRRKLLVPPLNACGWSGRIAKGVYEILNSHEPQEIAEMFDLKKIPKVESLVKQILSGLEEAKDYWVLEGEARKIWLKVAERAIADKRCEIDERVTTDIKRLIRLPGTLHGGTGLIVLKMGMRDLEAFDPYEHAVAFKKGEIKVKIVEMPKITFLGQEWGPYRDEVVEVPLGLAIYLICSDNATINIKED